MSEVVVPVSEIKQTHWILISPKTNPVYNTSFIKEAGSLHYQ